MKMQCITQFASLAVLTAAVSVAMAGEPDFGTDVRPILAKHCVTCHGPDPDAREAGLRLDTQTGSRADLGGYHPVVPGKPDESEMIARVSSDDADVRMPPADKHPPLSKAEIQTLRDWIAAGGDYESHWAFTTPDEIAVPTLPNDTWSNNAIDRFVLKRMREANLQPAPEASKTSLIRRVYLDLAGVTPSPEDVDRFLSDERPNAYRRLIDRLIASPDYAERFTRPWLDLARYSDTNGYEKDRERTIWPYRDWVIQAIARDMPFDQFTVEQLAGDMLPGATQGQRIATGFHRNTMLNEEGGIDPLEYRFYAMVDRVATTGTVWMGLTTGCAQCHTHKYDPITHTDYYSLMALMNNADEPEIDADSAAVTQQRKLAQRRVEAQTKRIARQVLDSEDEKYEAVQTEYQTWRQTQIDEASDWKVLRPEAVESTLPRLRITKSNSILASGDVSKREVYKLQMPAAANGESYTAIRLEVLPHESLPAEGPGMAYYEGRRGDFFLSELKVLADKSKVPFRDGSTSYGKLAIGSGSAVADNVIDTDGSTGWSTSERSGTANRLVLNFDKPFSPQDVWTIEMLFERHFVAALGHFRVSVTTREGGAKASLHDADRESQLNAIRQQDEELSGELKEWLRGTFIETSESLKAERKQLDRLRKAIPEGVRSLAMRERMAADNRQTHRHHRGEYLQPKERVQPAVPALFDQIDGEANRLTFARWLVSEKNPLVGRVTVNRAWREFFGQGIVRTAGDFGTQSEPPSHPDLLDWLDRDWRASGWSMKRLHRQIVMSATYRQAVQTAPENDLDNRLLSCFPHRRFDAERIRDGLLSASGLLARKVGGPSVFPPQPASVIQVAYGGGKWDVSQGADRFRRSVYTYGKRTAPFAAFNTFDAPSGELCVARREASTTPLQALTLMNDAMYLEYARGLAKSSTTEARDSDKADDKNAIASRMFRQLLTRSPGPEEVAAIVDFYDSVADHEEPWTLVARALMNTDEAITTP